ncbi:hypothetical protein [Streptomyces sp. NPDC051014]
MAGKIYRERLEFGVGAAGCGHKKLLSSYVVSEGVTLEFLLQ